MTVDRDVDEFLHKFGLSYKGPRRMLPPSLSTHRIAHMTEELEEYITASSREEKLDALIYLVEPAGPACHTGERTCFHNSLEVK